MRKKLPPGTLERLWRDPANWNGFSYACAEDPRVIVPKRSRLMGWTINWAQRNGAMRCFIGIAVIVAVLGLAAATRDPRVEVIATILVVLAVAVGCYRLADPRRYEERG